MRDPASADLEAELQSQIRELRSKREYIMKYPESIIGSGGFDTSNPKRKRDAKLAKIAAASTCCSPRSSSLTSALFSAPSSSSGSPSTAVSSPRAMSEGLTSPISDLAGSSATSPKRVSMRPGADRRYHTMRQLVLMRESRTGSAPSSASLLPLSHSADSVKRSATAVAGTNSSGFCSPLRLSGGAHGFDASHPSPSDNSHMPLTSANDVNAMEIDIDEMMASEYLQEDSFDSDDENGSSPPSSPTRMVTRSSSSPFSQRTKRAHTAPSKMTTDHSLENESLAAVKVASPSKKRSPRRGTSPAAPIDRRITVFNSSPTLPEQSPSKGRELAPSATNNLIPPRSLLHFSEVPSSLSSIAPPASAASRFAYSGTSQHNYRAPTSEDFALYQYRSMENWSAPESHYAAPPMTQQPQPTHVRTSLSQSDRNVSYFGESTRRSPSDSSISDISYSASTTANPTPRSFNDDSHHVYIKYDESEPAAARESFSAAPYQVETGCLAINLHSNSYNSNYPRNSRCGQCANCLQASMPQSTNGWNGHFEQPQPRLSLGSFDASSGFGSQYAHQRTPSYSQAEEHSMATWSEDFQGVTQSSYPQANGAYSEQDTYHSYSYGSASFGHAYSSGHQQYAPGNASFAAPLVSSRASSISSASGDLAPSFAAGLDLNQEMPLSSAANASVHGTPIYSASMTSHAAAVRSPPQQRHSASQSSNSPVPTLNVPVNSAGATNASFMSWKKGDQSSAVLIPTSLSGYQQFYGAPMNADMRYGQAEARRMSSSGMDVGGDYHQGPPHVVTSPAPHAPHHVASYSSPAIPANVYNHHMEHGTSAWP